MKMEWITFKNYQKIKIVKNKMVEFFGVLGNSDQVTINIEKPFTNYVFLIWKFLFFL